MRTAVLIGLLAVALLHIPAASAKYVGGNCGGSQEGGYQYDCYMMVCAPDDTCKTELCLVYSYGQQKCTFWYPLG